MFEGLPFIDNGTKDFNGPFNNFKLDFLICNEACIDFDCRLVWLALKNLPSGFI